MTKQEYNDMRVEYLLKKAKELHDYSKNVVEDFDKKLNEILRQEEEYKKRQQQETTAK